ncbi:MAG: hypothetical protein DRH24_14875 [Deltaproteobacteria bacterium]|nr:MAG: hypothetical protein DRH24_14875 [Deltaproteobacteria bacterium]
MRKYVQNYLRIAARKIKFLAQREVRSRTLRRAMAIDESQIGNGVIKVYVPHYWARFVHDGTGRVRGVSMVWFPNPKDDPRLRWGRPIKRSQVKRLRLSRRKFYALKKAGILVWCKNRRAIKGNPFFKKAILRSGPAIEKLLGDVSKNLQMEIIRTFDGLRTKVS